MNFLRASEDYRSIKHIIEKQTAMMNHVETYQKLLQNSKRPEFIKAVQDKMQSIQTNLRECQAALARSRKLIEKYNDASDEIVIIKDHIVNMTEICHKYNAVEQPFVAAIETDTASAARTSSVENSGREISSNMNTRSGCSLESFTPIIDPSIPLSTQKPIHGRKLESQLAIEEISPITDEEFEKIPVYMRGRIALKALEKFIDCFNQTLNVKYDVYFRSLRSLKKRVDIDLWKVYKSEDVKGTKMQIFITPKDITRETSLKQDKQFGNMITMLRHVKRIKEDRSGGIHRLLVIPH